jgi:4-alpha-glucanotransferase
MAAPKITSQLTRNRASPNQVTRSAGVLLHISSLPSANFGADAFKFVDFLADIGARIWQTLPLNMTHDDGSPYQCLSAHAGNPTFIDFNALVTLGLLTNEDLAEKDTTLHGNRSQLACLAFANYKQHKNTALKQEYIQFCRENVSWLGDFACFLLLREKYHHASWQTWPTPFKNKQHAAIQQLKQRSAHAIGVIKFTQFLFFKQWLALKAYANQKGIAMFGDIPIFVAYDSADVWAKPYLFKLDKTKKMQVVAGVPPDYFSETGQRWGNPHYDWQAMQARGFSWWLARMRTQSRMFDLLRIDHFRGLEAAWEIAEHADTAVVGTWVLAPGDALLKAIKKAFPHLQLIAEDLGVITAEVNALREKYALPGMKILQFAFGGDDSNPYLPHNITEDSVVYTGTHDNDTTLGWAQQLDEQTKNHINSVLGDISPEMPKALIELALASKGNIVIIPMQDILGLDGAHRMNTPGTIENNWRWQFNWSQLTPDHIQWIKLAIKSSQRICH